MRLSEYLYEFRVTQVAFAKKIGVDRMTIVRIVNDYATPSLKLAIAIEDASDGHVTLRELVARNKKQIGKK